MTTNGRRAGFLLLVGFWVALFPAQPVLAASGENTPYFVSLKADEVNVRKGPGRNYEVVWTYRSLGLPLEVTGAHEHWRRVRDSTGAEGWVYFRLLTRLRMALVAPWEKKTVPIELRAGQSARSALVARLEPGVKVHVKACSGKWCRISVNGFLGWLDQNLLWGVYPGETIQ